jgi:hypothetical protein
MKTIEKEGKGMRGTHTVTTKHDSPSESTELKMDYPLSEINFCKNGTPRDRGVPVNIVIPVPMSQPILPASQPLNYRLLYVPP